MAVCPNCKAAITCGCQRTTAKDGTAVCKSCASSYNEQLNITVKKNTKPSPNAPTKVTATYKGKGVQLSPLGIDKM